MDSDTAMHIFEKYYQNDTKSRAKGNGIGISIAKRVIDLHRGKISVDSVPGDLTSWKTRY